MASRIVLAPAAGVDDYNPAWTAERVELSAGDENTAVAAGSLVLHPDFYDNSKLRRALLRRFQRGSTSFAKG